MPIQHHYWHRQPPVEDAIAAAAGDAIAPGKRVLDVGAGYAPWSRATDLLDIRKWNPSETRPVHLADIDTDLLPFPDQHIDFLYARHTLEDLHNPLLLCREINRVAKAGYIETPSPACEFCRGVDAGKPRYRGYIHHRWFIWHEQQTLFFLPKYPAVEYIDLGPDMENRLVDVLNNHPIAWNTYFSWTGSFNIQLLRHDVDFDLRKTYAQVIVRAINASIENALRFAADHNLAGAPFTPSR